MRTKAIIYLNHFLENLLAVKARIGINRHICIPVKADGYGHGAIEIAKTSLKAGVFCFGIAAVEEGIELRKGGIKAPLLLFSQPHFKEIPAIIYNGLIPYVSDSEFITALNDQAKLRKSKIPVHLKIDTGMGRLGCLTEEAPALAQQINKSAGLKYMGTATHFAVSDSTDPADIAYTKLQIVRFKEALESIKSAGIEPGIVNAANSGAVILHPESWFDMVRPGIFLYGYKTADESKIPGFPFERLKAKPVMELRCTVVLIKKVKKGESVSYGRIWTAEEDTNIAILSAGYADGLPRLASSKWQAVINGKNYPLVGRICMDQCCVDLGAETDVLRWDEASLFGGSAPDAGALAASVGTIPYEITCGINKRVERVNMYTP